MLERIKKAKPKNKKKKKQKQIKIRDFSGYVPVKLVQTLFSNKSIPEQAARLVRPNFQQVLSGAIPRPRVQIVPQKTLDPVGQVTRGKEVMGVIVNSELGAYLKALHKLLFLLLLLLYYLLCFLEIMEWFAKKNFVFN